MKKLGFTLIELLIVISIIAIMVALILPNLAGARERAKDSRRKTDLNSLQQALRLYYNDHQAFPVGNISALSALSPTYMSAIPVDPSSTATNVPYNYTSTGNTYILYTTLENASDPDITASQARCTGEPTGNTYVVCEQ